MTGGTCGSRLRKVTVPRLSGWFISPPTMSNRRILFCSMSVRLLDLASPINSRQSVGYREVSTPAFNRPVLRTSVAKRVPMCGFSREMKTSSMSGPRSWPSSCAICLSIGDWAKATAFMPGEVWGMPSYGSLSTQLRVLLGWSWRFLPTAGTCATGGMPRASSSLRSPTPLCSSTWGEPMAPAARMISRVARRASTRPSLSSSSTASARREPSKTTRRTNASLATVRLLRVRSTGSTKELKASARRPPAPCTENCVGPAPSCEGLL
mmetsp:Transcript_102265/g.329732  ORF Transcript_102265/g.329732 Transcript_102265/m.329732 type:complete len:266 (-) Transcript_102265:757-1554(-)